MVDQFLRRSGPPFDVNDVLPFVRVPAGEQPIVLEALDVAVVIAGMFAETTQTMVFRNPNHRALEGQLSFPLPDNGVVCGYAIDVDGELVDGVIVAKQEARKILEAEIRKGVDPGLVEQVQGNLYRTRIYPLPPGGTRTVRLTYVSDLAVEGTSAGYHLPLAHARSVERVSLRIEVKQGEVTPVMTGGVGNLTLAQLRDGYVAEAKLPRGTACDDLVVRLPDLPRHLRAVERCGPDAFFAISSVVPDPTSTWTPKRIAIVWDASGSRIEVERDLELVAALLAAWPQLVVDVRVLRDTLEPEARSFAGRAERDRLVGYLRELPRDGGTGLARLDLAGLLHADAEVCLVFSDGLNTLRRGVPSTARVPVIAVSSAAKSDAAYLRHLATQDGGVFIDLLHTPTDAAVKLVASARDAIRIVGVEGCADVHVRRVAGRLSIVGRLTAQVGQVRLAGSGAPDDHISIPRAMAVDGGLVARSWAGQETRARAVADPEDPQILVLAQRHGLVTANASLLVLDSLEQHLEYGIEPAASRTAMRQAYLTLRDRKQRDERASRVGHVEQVVALWNERVRWWETDYTPRPPARYDLAKRGAPRSSPSMNLHAGASDDLDMSGPSFSSEASSDEEVAPGEMAPPSMARMSAAAPAAAAAPGAPAREGGDHRGDDGGARGA
ncbi:MAG: VIT domain-containing protein, partial [Proteobacteria bacterium]|nr:VIT domain-containing protein [Pseudomonadota bacterium]